MNGPGTVIFTGRSVWLRRNSRSRTWTGVRPVDRADDARHRVRMPGAVERGARVVDVDAVQRRGEVVGVALAADLAVGEQVQPGALLGADRELRRVVLGLREQGGLDAPQLLGAHARREAAGELRAVDQPLGLGVAADQRRRENRQHGLPPQGTRTIRSPGWSHTAATSTSGTGSWAVVSRPARTSETTCASAPARCAGVSSLFV